MSIPIIQNWSKYIFIFSLSPVLLRIPLKKKQKEILRTLDRQAACHERPVESRDFTEKTRENQRRWMSVRGPDTRVNQDVTWMTFILKRKISIISNDPIVESGPPSRYPGLPMFEQESPASWEVLQSLHVVRTAVGVGPWTKQEGWTTPELDNRGRDTRVSSWEGQGGTCSDTETHSTTFPLHLFCTYLPMFDYEEISNTHEVEQPYSHCLDSTMNISCADWNQIYFGCYVIRL